MTDLELGTLIQRSITNRADLGNFWPQVAKDLRPVLAAPGLGSAA